MDRLGDQFLSSAGGSGDQNRRFGLGHFADQVINLQHEFALAHNVPVPVTLGQGFA